MPFLRSGSTRKSVLAEEKRPSRKRVADFGDIRFFLLAEVRPDAVGPEFFKQAVIAGNKRAFQKGRIRGHILSQDGCALVDGAHDASHGESRYPTIFAPSQ